MSYNYTDEKAILIHQRKTIFGLQSRYTVPITHEKLTIMECQLTPYNLAQYRKVLSSLSTLNCMLSQRLGRGKDEGKAAIMW